MRIPPFHSPLRGIGLAHYWHDHSRCPIAQSIAPTDKVAGRGQQLSRCPYCKLLDRWPKPPPSSGISGQPGCG